MPSISAIKNCLDVFLSPSLMLAACLCPGAPHKILLYDLKSQKLSFSFICFEPIQNAVMNTKVSYTFFSLCVCLTFGIILTVK